MKNYVIILVGLLLAGLLNSNGQEIRPKDDPDAFFLRLDTLLADPVNTEKRWLPLFQGSNLLAGFYRLKAGEEDRQRPHDTDEVYYVLKGKARLVAGEQETEVTNGSVLFVKANVAHRFIAIEEDLEVLVFFDQ